MMASGSGGQGGGGSMTTGQMIVLVWSILCIVVVMVLDAVSRKVRPKPPPLYVQPKTKRKKGRG